MEADRKRRIESLSSHFADKLEKKRRKLFQLHVELSDLEKASYSTKKSDLPTLNFNGLSGQPASPSPQCKTLRLTSPNVGHSGKEACVLARIAQLQKEGRWHSAKKLPKLVVPARSKTHWDFVLEEMRWLCGVFQDEIKMKKAVSKKCSRMVQKHFTDKVLAVQRAEKAHEQNLRRIASNIAKEVRNFWSDIEKLFKFRIKSMVDDKRKRALDEHLNFIVDKTEKYSTLLAESLAESASLKTTPNVSDSEGGENDDDYMPDQNSDDDEGTIAKEEDAHEDDEIDMLKAESDIPVEELLKLYHPELYIESANVNNEDGCPGRVDPSNGQVSDTGQERQCNDERKVRKKKRSTSKTVAEDTDMNGLEAMVSGSEDKLSDVIEMATRFQPTGNTLDTTSVKTKVPFLLKHTIREYQHIGLDWLVSLNERKLNGILADEMGLGKTIQTIAFLAHLACEKHQWGPHLIVVPTSVMLNWEMELKKWAPAFKVLTYYGSQKERRLKRVGWTKPNAFHVCITSYKLVVQDHQSFRRKRWQYFILDEAQHIKNFKSQRWQMLLNFSSEGRLLLTGTPLQNQLMELWSLMHFLMPNVFESHRDFKEWFSNPLTGMVEGSSEYNEGLVQRLHKVLRPFLLRRLKNEVEKQLPKKYEHVIKCPLSKRQRSLYDDFMSRAKTKETLESGNLLSVINVLMQLRKVCNHPNLFEPRPTVTPFVLQSLDYSVPRLVCRALDYHPLKSIDLRTLPLLLSHQEAYLSAIATNRIELLTTPSSVFESCILRNEWPGEVKCPAGKLRLTVKYSVPSTTDRSKISLQTVINNNFWLRQSNDVTIRTSKGLFILPKASFCTHQEANTDAKENENHGGLEEVMDTDDYVRDIEAKDGDMLLHSKLRRSSVQESAVKRSGIFQSSIFATSKKKVQELPELTHKLADVRRQHFEVVYRTNERRSRACPLYGRDLIESATIDTTFKLELGRALLHDELVCSTKEHHFLHSMNGLVHSLSDVTARLTSFMSRFVIYVPACVAPYPFQSGNPIQDRGAEEMSQSLATQANDPLSLWAWRLSSQYLLQLPETRLIQYDCGKLQVLSGLLTGLKNEGHRVLLFTQMTRVLDVLESFMNFHGHTYLRLDGSTRVEQRQILMERFNNDLKYFCFILSTRSGGVGVNLTGADTVIFYDSDWNPTMDAQAQDRCHRIGQTRDVHIYRLVSERSVEENILKKANQKRLLGDIAIEGGNFTTAQLKKQTIRDLFQVGDSCEQDDAVVEEDIVEPLPQESYKKTVNVFESALATVEENTDVQAMKQASQEADAEEAEFNEDADKEDDKFGHLMKQLTAVERYALAQVDYHGQEYKNEMLASADAEIEAQRKEFDAKKLEEMAENLADLSSAAASNSNVTSDEEDDEHSYDDSDSGSEGHQGLPSPRTRSRGDVGINLWNLDESRA